MNYDDRLRRIVELATDIEMSEKHPLVIYRPSELQEPFHKARCPEELVFGGKRSGKSVSCSLEFASRLLGRPVIGRDDQPIPQHWPCSRKDFPRLYWIIGWDAKHAKTIYKLLFEPGQGGTFRCIRDRKTGKWRIWNRADPDDVARHRESEPTPPLIPHEMLVGGSVDGISWANKKNWEWDSFALKSGALVEFWPSSALTAKPGEAVSGIWIDEDIQSPAHLKEWQDRLTDLEGWLLWSVWPQTKNFALVNLMKRAENCEDEPNPTIKMFQLAMTSNPFISDAAKAQSLERMGDEEEIARRDKGDLGMSDWNMYDFVPLIHCLRTAEFDRRMEAPMHSVRWKLTEILRTSGMFPRDWTRYYSIDPSNTRTAAHSWVVPPPVYDGIAMGNIAIVEWELVVKKHSAEMLAEASKNLMGGFVYEAFVMDQQIGRQTSVGRDETVFMHYEEAFRKAGLSSRMTMSGFAPGCNEPNTRYRTVRRMLSVQKDGMPLIAFVEHKIRETRKEFGSYYKKRGDVAHEKRDDVAQGTMILDQPANPRLFDCMASVEYGATFISQLMDTRGTAYVEPSAYQNLKSPILVRLDEIRKKGNRTEDGSDGYVHLGPGVTA